MPVVVENVVVPAVVPAFALAKQRGMAVAGRLRRIRRRTGRSDWAKNSRTVGLEPVLVLVPALEAAWAGAGAEPARAFAG